MPLYAHRLDLPVAYQAAHRLGRLFVLDKVEWGVVRQYARRWALMAQRATGVDKNGAELRFCWAARDAVRAHVKLQEDTERAIKRAITPMIAERAAWGALMAQAHDLNGDAGFPLVEDAVSDVVRTEVYYSLPPAPRGGRHE